MKNGGEEVDLVHNFLEKKQSEVVQMDDVTDNKKLAGSRSSRIITGHIYKPSEVVQLSPGTRVCIFDKNYPSPPLSIDASH